ncbi:MAG: SGNH/GDSL hydrolase family protein [Coprococcus sp.]
MKEILCFGDSNTYGLIPKSGGRYPWGIRWTSILSERLGFADYHVIEEGLCGRTTVFDDPLRYGRRGIQTFPTILESHNPVDIVIVMLGTNDCKTVYGATADVIGKGMGKIVDQIHTYAKSSKILIVSPIHLGEHIWEKGYDQEFSAESVKVSKKLADVYKELAERENAYFLDASAYVGPSDEDREHLNEEGHRIFAEAVYNKIKEIENL